MVLSDFQEHIKIRFPSLKKDDKLLVALSGGIDSVVLTHVLYNLNYTIELAHCNFQLRGAESDQDEEFVIDFAQQLGLHIYTKSFDTESYALANKYSNQEAAKYALPRMI